MLNNMGINPLEWFQSEKKEPPSWEDTAPCEYEPDFVNPLDSMPVAKDWFKDEPEKKRREV